MKPDTARGGFTVTTPLVKGKTAYLQYWDARRRVNVLEVFQDTVAVTAPDGPLPAKGVGVILQVPMLEGMFCYHTHVALTPQPGDDTLLLRRCASVRRFDRRRTWRVPVHSRTKVARHGEPRAFSAQIIDVSAEGAQLHVSGHFELGDMIMFRLNLPDELPHQVSAKVLRLKQLQRDDRTVWAIGVLFRDLSSPARKALTYFIWKRLQELYPREVHTLFRRSRDRGRELDRRLGLIGTPDDEVPPEISEILDAPEMPKDLS